MTNTIELTAGSIRNGYLRVSGLRSLFPADAFGGSNRSAEGVPIEVRLGSSAFTITDICGSKNILRERGAVRSFLKRVRAVPGDKVVVRHLGGRRYSMELPT